MDSQGRRANRKGERSATVKLTDEKVIEIRKIYAKGGVSQAAVGKRFGIGHTRAWEIVTRRAWKHI
jgi:hypothetical protein